MDDEKGPVDVIYYVIPFAGSCAYREAALQRVLLALQAVRERLHIVVVVPPNQRLTVRGLVDTVVQSDRCTTPEGLFNRSAAFNDAMVSLEPAKGAKSSSSSYVLFADADIELDAEALRACLERADARTVLSPFLELFDRPSPDDNDDDDGNSKLRHGLSFCSGIVGMPVSVWRRTGGWDERFRGWGFEDAAMDVRVHEVCTADAALAVVAFPYRATHHWHPYDNDSESWAEAVAANRSQFEALYEHRYERARTWIMRNGIDFA